MCPRLADQNTLCPWPQRDQRWSCDLNEAIQTLPLDFAAKVIREEGLFFLELLIWTDVSLVLLMATKLTMRRIPDYNLERQSPDDSWKS